MQIAKVVPKVKTRGDGIFDYAIPPQILPEVKIGVLVLVSFHGQKVEGIIVDIKRSSSIASLKPIIAIIDNVPVIDMVHTQLAKWMADYYLTDFSKCLFEMIVPTAKRTIKKTNRNIIPTRTPKIIKSGAKKYLIMANFSTRLKFYLQAIKKTLDRDQQIIILVPDLDLIPLFTHFLKNKMAILHAELSLTERWQTWDKIRRGEINIVIGSNSALFAPISNLGLVIIDQEENDTYKNYQSPRFNAVKSAEFLTKLTGAKLVLGSLTPNIETFHEAEKDGFLYFKKPNKKFKSTIVNMNFEKSFLSQVTINIIGENFKAGNKILLVVNRKGEGSQLHCTDCDWVYICPSCGLPPTPFLEKLNCSNCEKTYSIPKQCPKCKSFKLQSFGLTTKKVKKNIEVLFPGIKTIIIEKTDDNKTNLSGNWDLAIVTNFALKFNFPSVGLVVIINADQGLTLPDFRMTEKNFQSFYKFLSIAKNGIIQTNFPDSILVTSLSSLNYMAFFENEILNRKKTDFPPFGHLIRLIYKNQSEAKALNEAKAVSNLIMTKADSSLKILGPSATFFQRQRGFYFQQIILKFKNKISPDIVKIVKKLPDKWTIDVDPKDLL